MEITASQYVLKHSAGMKDVSYFDRDNYKRVLARCLFLNESARNLLVGLENESVYGNMNTSGDGDDGGNPNERPLSPYKGSNSNIFSFANKRVPVVDSYLKILDVDQNLSRDRKSHTRMIATSPERILDAPELIDDFYLNLLDWSCKNMIAIALGSSVYLWNASNGETAEFLSLKDENYVSALSFSEDGRYLSIGISRGNVELWDVEHQKKLRNMSGHRARIVSLSWNDHLLSSGSRDSHIFNHDVRLLRHHISTFSSHLNEVCGLRWSPDGAQLASGGNDNVLCIWSLHDIKPIHTFVQHKAAVKSLAWCPWQSNLLASGGGSNDRTIKFWNTSIGTCLNSIDAGSQVCGIIWSKHLKELVSSHGFSQNQIIVWKFPSMTKQADLIGHTSRVLHMSMSPDGTTIVSAAADETLRFWRIFDIDTIKSKPSKLHHAQRNLRLGIIR